MNQPKELTDYELIEYNNLLRNTVIEISMISENFNRALSIALQEINSLTQGQPLNQMNIGRIQEIQETSMTQTQKALDKLLAFNKKYDLE